MSTEYQYTQGFGAFQATPAPYPTYAGQPQVQYTGQVPPTTSYAMHPAGHPNPPTSPHEPAPAPDIPAVTSGIASAVMQRLLLSELLEVGFDSVSPLVLHRFENEVTAFLNDIFADAHDYANYANRANPVAVDLLRATHDHGLEPKDLYRMGQLTKKRRQNNPEMGTTVLVPPPSRSTSPELLPSDDEGTTPVVPVTLRTLPQNFHLPALPPKHTYLRTPISPPKKAALPSLEKKLKNASVVQESLKNLLLATEDNPSSEDKLLFDAAVNWESTMHPRKRWKVGL